MRNHVLRAWGLGVTALAGALLAACSNPSHADVNLLITEVMAVNRRTLAEQGGGYSDWIEIHNPSSQPVNLEGWHLTDNPKIPAKWRFPAVTIPGQGYLVVFASGRQMNSKSTELHANFKLDQEGGPLALIKPDGKTVSFEFAPRVPALPADVSYGLSRQAVAAAAPPRNLPEGTAHVLKIAAEDQGYFARPTPGAPNAELLATVTPAPEFAPGNGVYAGSATVRFKPPAPGVTIRYTLDGSDPKPESTPYDAPIPINVTTLVKARAHAGDSAPSAIVSHSVTITDEAMLQRSSNLPLVIMEAVGRARYSDSQWSPVALRVIDAAPGRRASLGGEASFDGEARVHYRGYTSIRHPKRSFAVKLSDASGDNLKESLLGMPKDHDWILYAPWPDKTLMRDVLAYELSNQMGHWAPRTRFVELYASRTGARLSANDYLGVYVLLEKIKRSKDRVNIQNLGPADNEEPAITGGYILKKDHDDKPDPRFMSGGVEFFYVEPKPEEMTTAQRRWIQGYMSRLDRAVNGGQFRDPARGYPAFIDTASFIDYFWITEMSKNIDGFRFSTFFTLDRGGKLKIHPIWDWNLSFGLAMGRGGYSTQDWYSDTLDDRQYSWYRRLFQDPDFEQRRIDRWAELRRELFAPERLLRRVDELAAQLGEAQQRNFQRWPIMNQRIHPARHTFESYEEEVRYLRNWIRQRVAWIDSQMPPAPVLERSGDRVALKSRGGQLYYTTDGSDPRAPGGAVSPKARAYDAPISLTHGTRLIARVKLGEVWTAPVSTGLATSYGN